MADAPDAARRSAPSRRRVVQGGSHQRRHWLQPRTMSGSHRQPVLDWLLPLARDRSVLDVGCATGHWRPDWLHAHTAAAASECVGIDVDEEQVAAVRAKGFEILQHDAEHLDLGRTFDLVFGGELIEHLANPGLFLESVVDHLAPGGALALTTPNCFALSGTVYRALPGAVRFNEDHVAWYDEDTLRQLLARYGMVSEITYVHHITPGRLRSLAAGAVRAPLPDRIAWPTLAVVARRRGEGPAA